MGSVRIRRTLNWFLDKELEQFNDRERYIFESRTGILGTEHKTLVCLGKELGISRERVRQLESRVWKRLRKSVYFCNASGIDIRKVFLEG